MSRWEGWRWGEGGGGVRVGSRVVKGCGRQEDLNRRRRSVCAGGMFPTNPFTRGEMSYNFSVNYGEKRHSTVKIKLSINPEVIYIFQLTFFLETSTNSPMTPYKISIVLQNTPTNSSLIHQVITPATLFMAT